MTADMMAAIDTHPQDAHAATWSAGSTPVAVVMISLNEAHNLEAVLKNLQGWAQEVFLVDSYSVDATVDIALRYGVHVVQRAFRGFGDQWNFAMRELPITAPWTMKLDPDERLSDELKQSISDFITTEPELAGIRMQRRLWFMGKALPVRQSLLRAWKTGRCRFSDVTVNEYPLVSGPAYAAHGDLEHHDSPDLHHWLEKQNRYGTAEAVARFEGAALSVAPRLSGSKLQRRMWVKKNYLRIPFRYSLVFFYNYLMLGAWRAGWVGYAWSRLRCDVYRLREYKLREIHLTGRLPRQWTSKTGLPNPRVTPFDDAARPDAPASAKSAPMPDGARFHEELAAGWTAGYVNRGFRRRLEFVKNSLNGLVKPRSRWLDAGCGSGILTAHLAALGATGMAVDASPAMIKVASAAVADKTGPLPFEFSQIVTVERLELADNTFDGVLCSSVIEYLDAPADALRELARVLRPGGTLLVSVANRRSLVRKLEKMVRAAGMKSRFSYLDVSRATYTRREITGALAALGMRVDRVTVFDPVFPALAASFVPNALIFVTATKVVSP